MSNVIEHNQTESIAQGMDALVLPQNSTQDLGFTLAGHGNSGFFFTAYKKPSADGTVAWEEKAHPMGSLNTVGAALMGRSDAFISQASFCGRKRRTSQLQSVSSLFVDLDVYRLGIEPNDASIEQILSAARSTGIPEPSQVIGSGNGLYLKWLLDSPLSASSLLVWKSMTRILIGAFTSFAADAAVKDVTRVLRPAGTINRKNPDRPIEVTLRAGSGRRHNFEVLRNCLLQLDMDGLTRSMPLSQRKDAGVIARIKKVANDRIIISSYPGDLGVLDHYAMTREPIMMQMGTTQHLNWMRFLDLRQLLNLRKGAKEGERNNFTVLMLTSLALAGVLAPDNFWQEAAEIARSMPGEYKPTEDGSLRTLFNKLCDSHNKIRHNHNGWNYSPIYTYSNQHIIDLLGITSEEMRTLKTVISHEEKMRRADERSPGRSERREDRYQRMYSAIEMREKGATLDQIGTKLQVDRSTVSRWLRLGDTLQGPHSLARDEKSIKKPISDQELSDLQAADELDAQRKPGLNSRFRSLLARIERNQSQARCAKEALTRKIESRLAGPQSGDRTKRRVQREAIRRQAYRDRDQVAGENPYHRLLAHKAVHGDSASKPLTPLTPPAARILGTNLSPISPGIPAPAASDGSDRGSGWPADLGAGTPRPHSRPPFNPNDPSLHEPIEYDCRQPQSAQLPTPQSTSAQPLRTRLTPGPSLQPEWRASDFGRPNHSSHNGHSVGNTPKDDGAPPKSPPPSRMDMLRAQLATISPHLAQSMFEPPPVPSAVELSARDLEGMDEQERQRAQIQYLVALKLRNEMIALTKKWQQDLMGACQAREALLKAQAGPGNTQTHAGQMILRLKTEQLTSQLTRLASGDAFKASALEIERNVERSKKLMESDAQINRLVPAPKANATASDRMMYVQARVKARLELNQYAHLQTLQPPRHDAPDHGPNANGDPGELDRVDIDRPRH